MAFPTNIAESNQWRCNKHIPKQLIELRIDKFHLNQDKLHFLTNLSIKWSHYNVIMNQVNSKSCQRNKVNPFYITEIPF